MKQAEKLAKASPEEVKALVEKEQYSLAEKIHVGNLLSGIAAKIVQLGVKSDKYCYEGAKHDEYLKKYDEPGSKYLKQQMYNMLSLPYYEFRKNLSENKPNSYDIMPTLKKSENYLPYPENKIKSSNTISASLLFDNTLRKDFSEGVEFQADQQ